MIVFILVAAGLVFALLYVSKRTGVKGVPANKKPNTEPPERQRERKSFMDQIRKAIAHIKPPQESDDNDPFGRGRGRSRAEEASYLRARLAMEDEQLEAAKKAKKKEAEEAEQRVEEAEKAKERAKEAERDDRAVPEQRRGREHNPASHDSTLARWYDKQIKRTQRDQPLNQEPKREQSREETFMDQIRKRTADIKVPDRSEDRDRDRGRGM
jgi:hypothetical protein